MTANLKLEWTGLRAFPDVEMPEEVGKSFRDNAILKASSACAQSGLVALADDSGLCVDALEGAPGIYSARFAGEDGGDQANNRLLLQKLEGTPDADRGARFRCVIALVVPSGHPLYGAESGHGVERLDAHPFLDEKHHCFVCDGSVEGRIAREPDGEGGFGYDPLFYYPPEGQTFATLAPEKKNAISHRANAMKPLLAWLESVS